MSREHLDDAALARLVVDGGSALHGGHLADCARCRDEAGALEADLGALGRRVRAAAPHSAGSFAWPQAAPSPSRKTRALLWSPAAGAAALALILAVIWLGFRADEPARLVPRLMETRAWAEAMDDEPERLGGFAGFLLAENSAGGGADFMNAEDDEPASGAEGVILWPGVM